jgi:hypothetical protein
MGWQRASGADFCNPRPGNVRPKVRFAVDSPLEGGVSCELVSEIEFASLAK